jgi:hypothetical protein
MTLSVEMLMSPEEWQDMRLDAGQYLTSRRDTSENIMERGGKDTQKTKTRFFDPSPNNSATQKKRENKFVVTTNKIRRNKTLEKKRKIRSYKFCNIRFFTNQSTVKQERFTICAF